MMKERLPFLVVPAKAGTHNPRRQFEERRLPHCPIVRFRVWIPAFAGTKG